jgi:hypothetical protein
VLALAIRRKKWDPKSKGPKEGTGVDPSNEEEEDPKRKCRREEADVDPERGEGEQAEDKEGRGYGLWRKERG